MLRVTELEPWWWFHYRVQVPPDKWVNGRLCPSGWARYMRRVDMASAHCLYFLCPKCFVKNRGSRGTHGVEVGIAGRGQRDDECSHDSEGKPSRWTMSGSGFHDLTLTPSIHLTGLGCGWHGFITNGAVTGDGVENWEASMRLEEEKDEQKSTGGGGGGGGHGEEGRHSEAPPPPNPAAAFQEKADAAFKEEAAKAARLDNIPVAEPAPAAPGAPQVAQQEAEALPEESMPPLHGTYAGELVKQIREGLVRFENAVAKDLRTDAKEIHDCVVDKMNELRGHFHSQ